MPVFLYGELAREPSRAERAYFRGGGLAELWLRMEAGELRPDFGPSVPAPRAAARRSSPRGRRSPPSTSSSRAPTSTPHAPSRRSCARPAGAARGAGDRPDALQWPRPGLDQRPRPADDARSAPWSRRCDGWRSRSAPARSRRSWSAWSRRRRCSTTRPTCRSAASIPARHVIERRLAALGATSDHLDSSPWPSRRTNAAASAAGPRAAASTRAADAGARRAAPKPATAPVRQRQQISLEKTRPAADLERLRLPRRSSPR